MDLSEGFFVCSYDFFKKPRQNNRKKNRHICYEILGAHTNERERERYTTKAKSLEMNGNRLKVGRACYTLRATVKSDRKIE